MLFYIAGLLTGMIVLYPIIVCIADAQDREKRNKILDSKGKYETK